MCRGKVSHAAIKKEKNPARCKFIVKICFWGQNVRIPLVWDFQAIIPNLKARKAKTDPSIQVILLDSLVVIMFQVYNNIGPWISIFMDVYMRAEDFRVLGKLLSHMIILVSFVMMDPNPCW